MKDQLLTTSALTRFAPDKTPADSRWRRFGVRIGAAGIIAIAAAALPLAFGTEGSLFSMSSARAQSADDSSTLIETDESGMDSPDDLDDNDEDEHGDDADDDGEHGADDSGEHGDSGADDGGEHGDGGDSEGGEHGDGGSGSGGGEGGDD